MKIQKNHSGFTLIEILVSLFLTGVIAATAFEFYVSMHNQTLAQDEISEMQQNARACIIDITKTLRMAGFKVGAHAPFSISGDSLYIFFSDTQPVDTVLYYLASYADYEIHGTYAEDGGEGAIRPKMLMKKVNSNRPTAFSDNIISLIFTQVSPSMISISITTQVSRADEDYVDNFGYRTYQIDEQVFLRNI